MFVWHSLFFLVLDFPYWILSEVRAQVQAQIRIHVCLRRVLAICCSSRRCRVRVGMCRRAMCIYHVWAHGVAVVVVLSGISCCITGGVVVFAILVSMGIDAIWLDV